MSDFAAVISPAVLDTRSLGQWLEGRTIVSCEDAGKTPAGHASNLILHLNNGEVMRISFVSWWGKQSDEEWPENQ